MNRVPLTVFRGGKRWSRGHPRSHELQEGFWPLVEPPGQDASSNTDYQPIRLIVILTQRTGFYH